MEEIFIKTLQETNGKFLTFRQDQVLLPGGRETVRDLVLHPGAVAVLARTTKDEIIMVRVPLPGWPGDGNGRKTGKGKTFPPKGNQEKRAFWRQGGKNFTFFTAPDLPMR